MGQNDPIHWLDVAVRDPILRAFVGFGMFISIVLFINDLRKRMFPEKLSLKGDDTATSELRAIRDDYRDYVRELRERIDELQEENTDLRLVVQKSKTQPIPFIEEKEDEE